MTTLMNMITQRTICLILEMIILVILKLKLVHRCKGYKGYKGIYKGYYAKIINKNYV